MTSFGLKILAIITMFIDHVGLVFFKNLPILRQIRKNCLSYIRFSNISWLYAYTK